MRKIDSVLGKVERALMRGVDESGVGVRAPTDEADSVGS
jgi:hypothetical protein